MTREDTFFRFQGVLAFLHLASALTFIILVAVKGDWTVPVILRFNSWRSLASGDNEAGCSDTNPCFVVPYETTLPGERLSLGYASACTSIISGFHHLYAYFRRDQYTQFVRDSVVVPRWVDYGFSSPLVGDLLVAFFVVSVIDFIFNLIFRCF